MQKTADFAAKSRIFGWIVDGLNYQTEHQLFPYISHIHKEDGTWKIITYKNNSLGDRQ
jgi:hypothetical protein